MDEGWRPIFTKSNDTSCLVRIAASILHYNNQVKGFIRDFHVDVEEIQYEEYVNDPAIAIQTLCMSLEVLGSCNYTQNLDKAQYQRKGENRGKKFEEIWSEDIGQAEEYVDKYCGRMIIRIIVYSKPTYV